MSTKPKAVRQQPVTAEPHESFDFDLEITLKVKGHTTSREALSSRLEYEYLAAIDKAVMTFKRLSVVDSYTPAEAKLKAFTPRATSSSSS